MSYLPELSDFVSRPDTENNVEGCFDCQTCDEQVEGAHLDFISGVIMWRCSKGHASIIEGFK